MEKVITLGLTILLKGMLGIFAISIILIIFIVLLNWFTVEHKNEK